MRMFSCRRREALVHDAPLFRRILGSRFDQLPLPLQRLHDTRSQVVFSGRCDIAGSASWPAHVLALFAGLPRPAGDVPVNVSILYDGNGETWTRRFDTKRMQSRLTERNGKLIEAVGPVQLSFALEVVDGAIVWTAVHARAFGLPLPLSWFRKVAAREAVENGRYTFDVRAELPVVGLLVHYRGWLE